MVSFCLVLHHFSIKCPNEPLVTTYTSDSGCCLSKDGFFFVVWGITRNQNLKLWAAEFFFSKLKHKWGKHIVNLTSARSLNFTLQSFTKIKLASISIFLANILLNFIFKDFYLNQLLSYIKYGLSNLFEKKKLGMSAVTIFQVPDEDLPINSTSVGNFDNSKC